MGFLLLQLHKNVSQRFRDLLVLDCICVVKGAEHVESDCCCPFGGVLVLGCHALQGAEDSTHGRWNVYTTESWIWAVSDWVW